LNESEINLSKVLEFSKDIAFRAGKILLKYQKKIDSLKVNYKEAQGVCSDADLKSEKFLIKEIKNKFPDHEILAEESAYMDPTISMNGFGHYRKSKWCWIIDPLDGTNNFLNGLDYYAICIALAHYGNVVLGLVYRPATGDCYFAEKNKDPAILNLLSGGRKKRIKRKDLVGVRKNLSDCLLVTGLSARKGPSFRQELDKFSLLLEKCRGLRRMGSAALDLCLVAEGKLDAFWEVGLSPWDVAAPTIICKQVGLFAVNYEGKKFDIFGKEGLLVTPGFLKKELISYLNS
jgi:myo-inositol-1(or 4)-monophosphatase